MHVQTFGSPEEMAEYLQKRAAQAHAGLHDAQSGITFGDKWVRHIGSFPDGQPMFEIGWVYTPEQIALENLQAGATWAETVEVVAEVGNRFADGFVTGRAYSVPCGPEGEYGITHKANIWPIEERLFRWMQDACCITAEFPPEARVLLQIAMAQKHAHDTMQAEWEAGR